MAGIFHPYYTVALAPAIGALVGIGTVTLFRLRRRALAVVALAAAIGLTAATSFVLLRRSPGWHPWLAIVVIAAGIVAALAMLAVGLAGRRLAVGIGLVALIVALAGPAAYAADTATTPHTGAIPSAGPAVSGGGPGGRFGGPGGAPRGGFGGGAPGGAAGGPQSGIGAAPGGGFGGATSGPSGTGSNIGGPAGTGGSNTGGSAAGPGTVGGAGGSGGGGGLLNAGQPSSALVSALEANASRYRWVAATIGSNNAAGLQLATGDPVMAIGGFNGTDPAPTLAQFEAWVAAGRIHYFIGGSAPGGGFGAAMGGSSDSSDITSWVSAHYTAHTIGGETVYDLTSPTSTGSGN
jgi:hypothetical protein